MHVSIVGWWITSMEDVLNRSANINFSEELTISRAEGGENCKICPTFKGKQIKSLWVCEESWAFDTCVNSCEDEEVETEKQEG